MLCKMKNACKYTAAALVGVGIIVGVVAWMKHEKKPKLKERANKALRAAGDFLEQLTEMTE